MLKIRWKSFTFQDAPQAEKKSSCWFPNVAHFVFFEVHYGLAVSLADESAKKLFIKSNHFKTESWFENLIWNSFAKANATDSKQPMFHA